VSTFSIPGEPGGDDVAFDVHLANERSDEIRRIGSERNELGNRLAVLGDHDPFRIDTVQQGQAPLLELCGRYLPHGHIIWPVVKTVMDPQYGAAVGFDGPVPDRRALERVDC
jgi:hypothetical protein